MSDNPPNPPAFPVEGNYTSDVGQIYPIDYGMSLRDYFAGRAIPSVIRMCVTDQLENGETVEELFARKAYQVADAMLAERSKP